MTNAEILAARLRREAEDRRRRAAKEGIDGDAYDATGVELFADLVEALPDDDPHLTALAAAGSFRHDVFCTGEWGAESIRCLVPDRRYIGLENFLDELVHAAVHESRGDDLSKRHRSLKRHQRTRGQRLAAHLREEEANFRCESAQWEASSWDARYAALVFDAADLAEELSDDDWRIVEMSRAGYFDGETFSPGHWGEDQISGGELDETGGDPNHYLDALGDAARRDAEIRDKRLDERSNQHSQNRFANALSAMGAETLGLLARMVSEGCKAEFLEGTHGLAPKTADQIKSSIAAHLNRAGWLDLPDAVQQFEAMKVRWELSDDIWRRVAGTFANDEGEYTIALGWALDQVRPSTAHADENRECA